MEPWNNAALLEPPIHTVKLNSSIDFNELHHICSNIIKILTKQSPLHKEGALCSRLIYKFDKKFRLDIGYRHFRKVHTALKKYLAMNVIKNIEYFSSALPSENDKYIPTRQMLEFVLIKLLSFTKIMLRINVCSKQAAIFYLDRIKRGETHWMCLMPYALMSRIWSISKVLLQQSTQWYTSLYKYIDKLQYKGLKFLPENYTLPTNIREWLALDEIDNFGRFEWIQKKHIHIDSTLLSSDDTDGFTDILEFVNKLNDDATLDEELQVPKIDSVQLKQVLEVSKPISVDQGEVVSREKFNTLHNNVENNETSNHTFESVINSATLKQFIATEDNYRNEDHKLSLTNHLSLMQWHALQKALLKASTILGNKRKIQRKLKKIWKEKCLDYK